MTSGTLLTKLNNSKRMNLGSPIKGEVKKKAVEVLITIRILKFIQISGFGT